MVFSQLRVCGLMPTPWGDSSGAVTSCPMANGFDDDPELLRVLQVCYETGSRGAAPAEQRSICHSWLVGPFQELFGVSFHQGRLRTLAKMCFLKEDNSSRGGHRRY